MLQVLNKVEIDYSTTSSTKNWNPDTHTHTHTTPHTYTHLLVLPYKGIQGERTLEHIKRKINKVLPENKNKQLVYTGTKFETKFNLKGKTKEHRHDLTYSVVWKIDETGKRLEELVNEYSGKDINSHTIEANHPTVIIYLFLEAVPPKRSLREKCQNPYLSNRTDPH